jgi:multidrug efflux system membrane fusion protein
MIIAIIVVLLLGVVWWINHRQTEAGPGGAGGPAAGRRGGGGGGGRGGFFGPNAPLPVGVRTVGKGDIHVYLNALGTVTAAHAATIRTQINGQLQQISFQEGQVVHEGDLLAIIDPRPYQNALAQAQAQLLQAQSQLRTVQADLQRYETLVKEDSIAKQQVDATRAQVNTAQGAVQVAEAAVSTANLNLTYCHIKAPFDGRVGLRLVDTGNYITPGDANGIVVLTQTKPITVIFTLPEDQMGPVAAQLRAGTKLPVDAFDRMQSKKLATGTLVTMDNQIDPTTGTFKLRAEFSNDDESLFPNQFVNVRLLVDTIQGAIVIPTSAVERGQQGTFVYVVTAEQTAAARPIKLGASEGELVTVESGLNQGDQIVTDGADRLKDGQRIILNGGAAGNGGASGGSPGGGNWQKGSGGGNGQKGPGGGSWQKGSGGPRDGAKKWGKKSGADEEKKE